MEYNHVRCVELMLEAKADVNTKDISGDVCLHYAIRNDQLPMVEALLAARGIEINSRNQAINHDTNDF